MLAADWGGGLIRYRGDALRLGLALRPEALAERHHAALDALGEVLADPSLQAQDSLQPGEVLLLDNRRTLHGRSSIRAGTRRHLRRLKAFRRPPGRVL